MELLALAIGIGLAVSVVLTELFGLASGGMVVPGYVALHLTKPLSLALTLAASFGAFAVVRALSSFIIVYGRRRTVLMILVGYVLGIAGNALIGGLPGVGGTDRAVIGYIIPGLIAIWLDRQGMVQTLCALCMAAVVVRLVLILVAGEALLAQ